MTVLEELRHALVLGPAAPARLRRRGWAFLALYLALAGAILGVVGWLAVTYRKDAVRLVAAYLFPDSWRVAAELLVERFARVQGHVVLVNAIIGGSLILVQLLLFPLKEKLSATFEAEARLTDRPPDEFPLWHQAWEEIILFLLFLAAQGSIFWLGWTAEPWRRTAAIVASFTFLFASFGIDFLSPLLQRHRLRYSQMAKTLALHPVTVFAFGALYTLPAVAAGRLIAAHPEWPLGRSAALLFGTSVACIAWAAVAGTWVASRLLPEAREVRRPSVAVRALAWGVLALVLAWNGYRFGAVGLALHHKSQILKCAYDVDWGSAGIDRPDWTALLGDELQVGVHVDVRIENPTRFDVEIEKNRLEIEFRGRHAATARLSPVRIPAGGETRAKVSFPITVTPSLLRHGRELLRGKEWRMTLYLEVAPGFELPVVLRPGG